MLFSQIHRLADEALAGRASRISAAMIGLVLLAGAGRAASPQVDHELGRIVASLQVQAPPADIETFTLHGTVPLPPGVHHSSASTSPLSVLVRGESGTRAVPTQISTVSRYPTGESDVVEIMARVRVPKHSRPGARLRFNIVRETVETEGRTPRVPDSVRKLLRTPGSVYLRTRDVFGNVYTVDVLGDKDAPGFGSERILKTGVVTRQRRVYGTMVPLPDQVAEGEALPHMMGMHAYVTEWTDEAMLSLDLRVNNGAISAADEVDPLEETLGVVYWRELELVVPRGWVAVPKVTDPYWGKAYSEGDSLVFPIVEPNKDGSLHMMPPQAQFHRRLILARNGHVARARTKLEGLGHAFCIPGPALWSWFNPATARYFAQRDILASLDFMARGKPGGTNLGKANVRAEDRRRANELKRVLQSGRGGSGYAVANVMGWAHPWFIRIEGGAGGEGIAMFEGYRAAGAASIEDYNRLQFLHRMNMSRQPEAAYDRRGDPVGFHAWMREHERIPFDFRTNGRIVMPPFRLPMNRGRRASDQVLEVVKRGLRPSYDRGQPYDRDGEYPGHNDVLLSWSPHDGQHMIRYTKNTKALVWLGNDALAKDDLILSAELFRLMWHEADHEPASWSRGITLKVLEGIASEHPHTGLHVTRDHAWGIDSMSAAYSVAPPRWRNRNRSWFIRVSRLLQLAAMPSGIVQRNETNPKILGHRRYAAAQGFEVLFMLHAIRCINESVFREVEEIERFKLEMLAVQTVEYLFWGPVFRRFKTPYQPNPSKPRYVYGPLAAIPVALNDGRKTPPFSDASHWGANYLPDDFTYRHVDTAYVWQALSYAHQITNGDEGSGAGLQNRYLKRVLACGQSHTSFSQLMHTFREQAANASIDDSKNWIGLFGKLQNLGVH